MLKNKNKAFTLIELLIVIAIIGLLASIVLFALSNARQKSRVAKRVSDLKQMVSLIELYHLQNNSYPFTPPIFSYSECPGFMWQVPSSHLIPSTVPTLASSLPSDPAMKIATAENCYVYLSDSHDYKIMDYNITDMSAADINRFPTLKDPARNGGAGSCPLGNNIPALAISTAPAICW